MEMDSSPEKEAEDEVMYEMDVYLSRTLLDSLYLFDYPGRMSNSSQEENQRCVSAKVKPKQQKVKLEFDVNRDSDYYDKSRGEEIAYNVDGRKKPDETYYKSAMMDKTVLCGTKSGSSADCSALCYLKNGVLHVTPFYSVVELKPGLEHIDMIDSASKKASLEEEDDNEEEEAVAVTVRFEGPDGERDRQLREKSFQFIQQKNASEPWIDVNYHGEGTNASMLECKNLICSSTYRGVLENAASPEDYLKCFIPESLRLSGCEAESSCETALLLNKPISDQMKHLMMNAQLLPFSMIQDKLPPMKDPVYLERQIQQIGVLVQGCWAIKSELLYNEDAVSPVTGISCKSLINARDYLLWLFTKSTFILRKDLLTIVNVLNADFLEMIHPLAIKSKRGWQFKFPCDEKFIESHPSIYQSQQMKWDLRYRKLVKELGVGESEGESSKSSVVGPSRPRQKRTSHSSISEGDESGTDSGVPGTKEAKVKRTYSPSKRLPTSPTKNHPKAKPFHIATLDISPTFLEAPLPLEIRTELRDYMKGIMQSQYCISLQEIKDLVQDSDMSTLAQRGDFEKLLEDALVECGAQKLKNKWPQNTSPQTLYAFAKFGNKLDRYRSTLLDLFTTTARARINLFMKKVEDELRELISDADCRQVFEEYCVHKSGYYYLKGTIPF